MDAPGGLSSSELNLFNLEVEIGFIMGSTLKPRDGNADGGTFSEQEVWAAVKEVVLSLEICGKRTKPGSELFTNPPSNLIGLADCSSAGGVVCGKRFTTSEVTPEQLRDVQTELVINGERVVTGAGSNVRKHRGRPRCTTLVFGASMTDSGSLCFLVAVRLSVGQPHVVRQPPEHAGDGPEAGRSRHRRGDVQEPDF